MTNIKYRYWDALHRGAKLPRRIKKALLGKKISGPQLKRLLKQVKIVLYKDKHRPSYPHVVIEPYSFCPKCGCDGHRSVNHHVEYPEIWINYYCLRCGFLVASADNSPYIHVLEEMYNDQYEAQISKGNLPELPEDDYSLDFLSDII